MTRLLALAIFAAVVAAVAPGQAAAQIGGQGSDYCATKSPYKSPPSGFDPIKELTLSISGPGTVAYTMYDTPADPSQCITPNAPCTTASCVRQIMTVCSFHCYSHLHLDPQHWQVRLTPTPAGGAFLGWVGADVCAPPPAGGGRSDCLLLMDRERSTVAVFGTNPDNTTPSAPGVTVRPERYALNVSWAPSSDDYLAGYEVWLGTKLLTRLDRTQTSYRAANLQCATPYTVRIVAFDTLNSSAGEAATATGECAPALAPRPNTVIHVKPRRTTKSRTAFFHFGTRGEISATKYQCKLDKGRWLKCSGLNGKRYRSLKKGYHVFQVRAGNAAGWDATPAKWRWRIR